MENTTNKVVEMDQENVVTYDDEPIIVSVEAKEGFWAKAKKCGNKFINSIPGKIICGAGLIGVGVLGAIAIGLLGGSSDDEDKAIDVDYSEIDDEEFKEYVENQETTDEE